MNEQTSIVNEILLAMIDSCKPDVSVPLLAESELEYQKTLSLAAENTQSNYVGWQTTLAEFAECRAAAMQLVADLPKIHSDYKKKIVEITKERNGESAVDRGAQYWARALQLYASELPAKIARAFAESGLEHLAKSGGFRITTTATCAIVFADNKILEVILFREDKKDKKQNKTKDKSEENKGYDQSESGDGDRTSSQGKSSSESSWVESGDSGEESLRRVDNLESIDDHRQSEDIGGIVDVG
jgi:hypothetical protein